MNKPVLFAAMIAALPLGASAEQETPDAAPDKAPTQSGCADPGEAPRASSALPARASTKPAPQLGTVAPNTRVPSHAVTPSMRAMRAASAKEAARAAGAKQDAGTGCAPPAPGAGTGEDVRKS